MVYNKDIVEKLSQFNNLSFTKKQWEIILKGCGCPKSTHLWIAFRDNNLQKDNQFYTLINLDNESFSIIWDKYCQANRAGAKKAFDKAKARRKVESFKGLSFYMVGGVLTTEKPEREW